MSKSTRLDSTQKEIIIEYLAEGLNSTEVIDRAKNADAPFSVTKRQVNYYRKMFQDKINDKMLEWEEGAINRGLARKCIRIKELQELAQHAKDILYNVEIENVKDKKMMIDAYRAVMDDIAKELGHRVHKTEVTGEDGGAVKISLVKLGGIDPEEDI